MTTLTEFRLGRNFVRLGDVVHVKPSKPGKRDGFDTRVRRIIANETTGGAALVDVAAPNGNVRTLPIERIERRAQTKANVR